RALVEHPARRKRRVQQESQDRKGPAESPASGMTRTFRKADCGWQMWDFRDHIRYPPSAIRHPQNQIMHKFLLWDHDGVLVDTEPLYFAATQESIRLLGLDIDQAEYLRLT